MASPTTDEVDANLVVNQLLSQIQSLSLDLAIARARLAAKAADPLAAS